MRHKSILGLILFATGLQAGTITSVASRLALNANDLVVWGTSAQDGTPVSSPYVVNSTGGLMTSSGAASLLIFEEGGAVGGFQGNFTPGDILLASPDAGPIDISFGTPIRGIGFNIQHIVTGAFTATINFYGAGNTLFGSVIRSGNSTNASDGSAIFIGGTSSAQDIVRIAVSVNESAGSTGLIINSASIVGPEIPEPSTISLMAAAAVAFAFVRRRR